MTRGNIAELAASAFVALLAVLLSVRTIGYKGEQCSGGESVSQLPLKYQALSIFLGQNPPFELRAKTGVSPQSFHRASDVEVGFADPHSMQDTCELARDRIERAQHARPFGDPQAPRPQC